MSDLTGTQLGAYRIVEEIGRGGMAVVYKAYQPALDRHVAIKVLRRHLAEESELVERFLREARAAAKLRHPSIIYIYDVGHEGDWYYIVMDYVEGPSLAGKLKSDGALDVATALSIVRQIGSALDYAHAHGVVHRDVKPSNILLTAQGQAILVDFGIARAAAEARLTRTGMLVGTPEYMSPEQAEGQSTDGRSDVYSLGVVLYEMLTGRAPFGADTPAAVLYKQVHEAPLPLSAVQDGISAGVEAVVLRALAKDRRQRYQTAGEMVSALSQAEVGAGTRAHSGAAHPTEGATTAPIAEAPSASGQPAAFRSLKNVHLYLMGAVLATLLIAAVSVMALYLARLPSQPRRRTLVASAATATAVPTASQTARPVLAPTSTAVPSRTRTATATPTLTASHTATAVPVLAPTSPAILSCTPTAIARHTPMPTPPPMATGVWSSRASMSVPRDRPAAVSLGGRIYAIGGSNSTGALASMEMYDPVADTWSTNASMPGAKSAPGAVVVNGRIYVMGPPDARLYEYNPVTASWATRSPLPVTPGAVSVASISGNVFVAFNTGSDTRPSLYMYDPFQDQWHRCPDHPDIRAISSLGVADGMLYAVGGALPEQAPGPIEPTRIDRYDPMNDTWTRGAVPPLAVRRTHLGPTLPTVGGRMYVIAGWDGYSALASVEVYDPWSNSWSSMAPLPTERYSVAYAAIGHKIYAVGGNWGGAGEHWSTTNEELTLPEPAQPENPIVFVSDQAGYYEMYRMNADGTRRQRITNDPYAQWAPSCSSAVSERIAVADDRRAFDIYTLNADGSDWRRITTDSRNEYRPTWSPDGQEIAFLREESEGVLHLWVVSADGSSERRLTSGPGSEEGRPAWSPDGGRILFTSNRSGNWQIWTANASDGSGLTRLTNLPGGVAAPDCSPDGRAVVFDSGGDIYVMNADGTHVQNLTRNGLENYSPQWSADGTRIAFHSYRPGHAQVYVMNADGSNQHNISNNSSNEWEPAWARWCREDRTVSEATGKYPGYLALGRDRLDSTTRTALACVARWLDPAQPLPVASAHGWTLASAREPFSRPLAAILVGGAAGAGPRLCYPGRADLILLTHEPST